MVYKTPIDYMVYKESSLLFIFIFLYYSALNWAPLASDLAPSSGKMQSTWGAKSDANGAQFRAE
jgi:hypothetical protein